MRKKSSEEMQRARIGKTVRSLVRLKYSILADQEINEILPAAVGQFDEALANGQVLDINIQIAKLLGEG